MTLAKLKKKLDENDFSKTCCFVLSSQALTERSGNYKTTG